jgi:hypothetical protein
VRDRDARRARGITNTLWTTWLRRPALPALRRTVRLARSVPRDRVSARGFAQALAGAPRVLRHRRVTPTVEHLRALLDD